MRGLTDKIAVIAGGGSGIGAATARRLAEEGACVVVGDVNGANAATVAESVTAAGGRAIAVTFDIAEDASVDELIGRAVATYGGIDAVHVNAADLSPGTIGADTDVLDVDLDVFDRTLEVGLRGHVLVTRRALPELLARGGGALVYTSSGAAFMGEPQRPSYGMAKAGLGALVRHVASRWGREGVRANGVAPGLVLTDAMAISSSPERQAKVLRVVRSPRLGRPADIAASVAFLMSEDGEWINGQVISVDGGVLLR